MSGTDRSKQDRLNRIGFPRFEAGAIESASDAYEAWLRCVMMMNTEAGMFLTKRLQRDAQFPLKIVECRSPQDVMQAQIEFFRTMANDYSKEAGRMSQIVTECLHSIDRPDSLDWPQPVEEEPASDQRQAA